MMTRKHFEAIAAIIRQNMVDLVADSTDHEKGRNFEAELIASDLADYFATENSNFDRQRFLTACHF